MRIMYVRVVTIIAGPYTTTQFYSYPFISNKVTINYQLGNFILMIFEPLLKFRWGAARPAAMTEGKDLKVEIIYIGSALGMKTIIPEPSTHSYDITLRF